MSTAALPDASLLGTAEAEARSIHAQGLMHTSAVKNATHKYTDASSRGDVVRWLDGTDGRAPACAALTQWLRGELMEAVRDALLAAPAGSHAGSGDAPKLVLAGAQTLPIAMLACYPGGGARFLKHVDNSPDAPDLRAVTAVLYLNTQWSAADGGALRIWAGGARGAATAPSTVEPRAGTLVLFWSHRVPHEVAPAATTRFALSLWMCVDPEQQPPGWLGRRDPAALGSTP